MSKRFLVLLATFFLLFTGILVFNKHKAAAPTSGSNGTVQASNHVEGKNKAGVVLVEYGDFQCPHCGAFYPVVDQVYTKYSDQISFQFRNFPLYQIHQNALVAARAAEAADKQGKFWEMHRLLFENQTAWSTSNNPQQFFDDYATQLGLNVDKFNTDLKSSEINDIVQADLREAKNLNLTGTPSFFLNGKALPLDQLIDAQGNPDYSRFDQVIGDAIKAKTEKQ